MRLNVPKLSPSEFQANIDVLHAARLSTFLWGPPGVGKSACIKEYAKEHDIHLVIRMLGQMQAGDLCVPYREGNRLRYAIADFILDLPEDKPSILFLDELNTATPDVQVMALQLLLDFEIAGHKLPKSCWVVAAGNRLEDGAMAYEMNTAMADRQVHFEIDTDVESWLAWAKRKSIDPVVLGVIQVYPELLNGTGIVSDHENLVKTSPRSWERVSILLSQNPSLQQIYNIVPGIIGESAAAKFKLAVESARELRPVESYLSANREELLRMSPTTLTSLYSLAYSLTSYCSDVDQLVKVLYIYKIFAEVQDSLPRREVLIATYSMLLMKAINKKWLSKVFRSKMYLQEIVPVMRSLPKLAQLEEEYSAVA